MEGNEKSTPKSSLNNAQPQASDKKNWGTQSVPDSKPKEPQYLKQAQRFVDDPEYQKKIAAKGGAVCVPTPHYSKCRDCDFKSGCPEKYKEAERNRRKGKELLAKNPNSKNAKKLANFEDEDSRCIFELDRKKTMKSDLMRDYKAFVSFAPENTLDKLHMLFKKLENCVDDDPSYTKLASLFYMMMNIYKMKFGKDAPQLAVQINNNNGNPSVDIKAIMDELRGAKAKDDKVEDAEYKNVFAPPSQEDEGEDASEKDAEQFDYAPKDEDGGGVP